MMIEKAVKATTKTFHEVWLRESVVMTVVRWMSIKMFKK